MVEHADELQLLETLDIGKPIRYTRRVDLEQAQTTYRWFGELIDKLYDDIAPTGPNAVGLITREPVGVVGAITPWNFPMMISSWKLAPALVAGNSVVLKPAEQSPLTARQIRESLKIAGRDLAHTSVITTVQKMADKGQLKQLEPVEGKAFRFSPRMKHQDVSQRMLADLVHRVFDGSAEALMLSLFDVSDLDDDSLKRLRRAFNQKMREQQQ